MATRSYNLTPIQETEIQALIRMGVYANQSEILRASLDSFLRSLPQERRTALAVQVYRDAADVTIGKAAEIAGLPFHEMRRILVDEGVVRLGRAGPHPDRSPATELMVDEAAKAATHDALRKRFADA